MSTYRLTDEEYELRRAEADLVVHLNADIKTRFDIIAREETTISTRDKQLVLSNKSCDFVTITATLHLTKTDKDLLEIAQLGAADNSIVVKVDKHPGVEKMVNRWMNAINAARAKLFYEKCQILGGEDGSRIVRSLETQDIYTVPNNLLGKNIYFHGSTTLVLRKVLERIQEHVEEMIAKKAPTPTPVASSSSASSEANEKMALSVEPAPLRSRVYFSDPNWVTMEANLEVCQRADGVGLLHTRVKVGCSAWNIVDYTDDDAILTHRCEGTKDASGPLASVRVASEFVGHVPLKRTIDAGQVRDYESLVRFLYEVDRAREENLVKMRSKAASSSSSNAKEKIGTVSWKTNDHPNDDTIHAHKLESSKDTSGHLAIVVWVANKVVGRLALLRSNTATQDQREYEAIVRFLFEVDRAREGNLAKMRSKVASSSSSSKEKDPAPKTITLLEIPGEENKVAVSEEGESTLVPSKSAFHVDYDGSNTVIQVLGKTWEISNSAVEFKYHTLCGCADRHHSSVKFGGELVGDFVGFDNLIVRQHLLGFLIKVDEERRRRFYRECKIVYRAKEYFGAKVEELDFLVEIHRDWLPNPDKIAAQSTVLVLRSLFDRRGPANATPRRMTIPSTEAIERVFKRVISQNGTSVEYVFRNFQGPLTPQPFSREQKDASASVERLTAETAVRESGAAEAAAIYNSGYGAMGATDLVGDKPEPTTVRCLTCGHVSPTPNETPCRCRASEEDQEPEEPPSLDATIPSAKPAVAEVAKSHSLPVVAKDYASLYPSAAPVTQESLTGPAVTTSGPNIYKGVTTSGLRMSYNSETRRLRIIGGECTVPELEKGKTCSAPTVTVRYEETKPKFLSVAMGYRGLKYCLMSTDDAHYAAVFCQDVADWLLKLHDDKIF